VGAHIMLREMRASGGEAGRQAMPGAVRYALLAGLAFVMGSALYLIDLIAVRGEALLADLSALSQRILLCF
jgi:hypothetical protein